jgi:outer membrane lipase/esterase
LYVFGDSYCDVGNIYLATGMKTPPSPPYFYGQFSNGPIWVERVAASMGLKVLPELLGGTDYAFGGALATVPYVTTEGTIPDVPQQVELYLRAHQGKADPKALYILEGGGNDILGAVAKGGGSSSELGFGIAVAISESELLLRRAGAKHFLIPNLLNVGMLPAAAPNRKFASEATNATNKYLSAFLDAEEFFEGIDIQRVNILSLFNEIAAEPSHFGFKNVTTPCLNTTTDKVCSDPNQTLFWDDEHPTEPGHVLIADTVLKALSK